MNLVGRRSRTVQAVVSGSRCLAKNEKYCKAERQRRAKRSED
jgi:hypothetical protein